MEVIIITNESKYGYRKKFFAQYSTLDFFNALYKEMKSEVEGITDSEILSCDFQDWTNYLTNNYSVAPITIFESAIDRRLNKTKIKRSNPNPIGPRIFNEMEFYEIDGVQVIFKIPFDGDPRLFDLCPSEFILFPFETQSFIIPQDNECGSFTLSFEYINQELENKGGKMLEYVQKEFADIFSQYKKMINNINKEVNSYNKHLPDSVTQLLEKRREKADSFSAISNALQIPLTINKNAPNIKPIQLKRVVRQPVTRPMTTPMPPGLILVIMIMKTLTE